MNIETELVEYQDGAGVFEAFVAHNADLDGPRPLVLVAHMWGGRVDFVCEKAKMLAELGYVGFALDMYGKGVFGDSPEQCASLMSPFSDDRALLQRRMHLALEAAKSLDYVCSEKIAAIGFCFGGMCVLDLARSRDDVLGVVSFHGLLEPPENLDRATFAGRVLVLHGHEDPMVTSEQIIALQAELKDSRCDWQFISFGKAMHAFTNPAANDLAMGTVYNAEANRRSWAYMIRFLGETLI